MRIRRLLTTLLCTFALAAAGMGCLVLTGCGNNAENAGAAEQETEALDQIQSDADAVNADDGTNASADEADKTESADTVDEASGDLDSADDEVAPTTAS